MGPDFSTMVLRSKWQLLVATASTAYLLQGYGHAVMNAILTLDSFVAQFPQLDTAHVPPKQAAMHGLIQGSVVGSLQLGCAVGSVICFFLGDVAGRKRLIMASSLVVCIGILVQCTAGKIGQLICGRILAGIGVGTYTSTIPMWLAECMPAETRGRSTLLCGGFANVGMLAASLTDLGFYFVGGQSGWRGPVLIQLFPGAVLFALTFSIPESPRWLLKKNKVDEAIANLAKLRGLPCESAAVHDELYQVGAGNDLRDSASGRGSLTPGPSTRPGYRAYLAVSLSVLCTMGGVNVITFFSTQLFEQQLRFSPIMARVLSAMLQVGQTVFAYVAVFFIDRFGRRVILLISAAVMAGSMAAMAGLSAPMQTRALSTAVAVLQFICVCGYPIGFHITPQIYGAEVSPLRYRHMITAASQCAHWVFDFLTAEITPYAFVTVGWRYYLVYVAVNAFNFVCIWALFPETKGRALEEIDQLFADARGPLEIVRHAKRVNAQLDAARTGTSLASGTGSEASSIRKHKHVSVVVYEADGEGTNSGAAW